MSTLMDTQCVEFEWFEDKRLATLKDRRIDFRDAWILFDGRSLYTYSSPRGEEVRFVRIGLMGDRFHAVIWTDREGIRRIISMRREWNAEQRAFSSLYG